mgnify:CR=1 FL=1
MNEASKQLATLSLRPSRAQMESSHILQTSMPKTIFSLNIIIEVATGGGLSFNVYGKLEELTIFPLYHASFHWGYFTSADSSVSPKIAASILSIAFQNVRLSVASQLKARPGKESLPTTIIDGKLRKWNSQVNILCFVKLPLVSIVSMLGPLPIGKTMFCQSKLIVIIFHLACFRMEYI